MDHDDYGHFFYSITYVAKMKKEKQYNQLMLLVLIVSLSCFTVTIILDLKYSEDKSYYTEEGRHFNLRWMLSLDKKDVHNNDQYKRKYDSHSKT
jgi:hypothetical protein